MRWVDAPTSYTRTEYQPDLDSPVLQPFGEQKACRNPQLEGGIERALA